MARTAYGTQRFRVMLLVFLIFLMAQRLESMRGSYIKPKLAEYGSHALKLPTIQDDSPKTGSKTVHHLKFDEPKRTHSSPSLRRNDLKLDPELEKQSKIRQFLFQFLVFYESYRVEKDSEFYLLVHLFLKQNKSSFYQKNNVLYNHFYDFIGSAMDPETPFYIRDYCLLQKAFQADRKRHYLMESGWSLYKKNAFQKKIIAELKKEAASTFNHFAKILNLFCATQEIFYISEDMA